MSIDTNWPHYALPKKGNLQTKDCACRMQVDATNPSLDINASLYPTAWFFFKNINVYYDAKWVRWILALHIIGGTKTSMEIKICWL